MRRPASARDEAEEEGASALLALSSLRGRSARPAARVDLGCRPARSAGGPPRPRLRPRAVRSHDGRGAPGLGASRHSDAPRLPGPEPRAGRGGFAGAPGVGRLLAPHRDDGACPGRGTRPAATPARSWRPRWPPRGTSGATTTPSSSSSSRRSCAPGRRRAKRSSGPAPSESWGLARRGAWGFPHAPRRVVPPALPTAAPEPAPASTALRPLRPSPPGPSGRSRRGQPLEDRRELRGGDLVRAEVRAGRGGSGRPVAVDDALDPLDDRGGHRLLVLREDAVAAQRGLEVLQLRAPAPALRRGARGRRRGVEERLLEASSRFCASFAVSTAPRTARWSRAVFCSNARTSPGRGREGSPCRGSRPRRPPARPAA